MTKITINLPDHIAFWFKGYAAVRNLTLSNTISELLMEKREHLAQEAEDHYTRCCLQEHLSKIKSDC